MKHTEARKKASHYAKALFELAQETKTTDKIAANIQDLGKTLADSPALIKKLASYRVSDDEREAVMKEICQKAKFHDYTRECLLIMARNKGIELIPDFIDVFNDYHMESQNICKVSIETVTAMTEKQKKDISTGFKKAVGMEAKINEMIDPSLLGGLVITYKSRQVDDSLKTKLERLKNTMKGTA